MSNPNYPQNPNQQPYQPYQSGPGMPPPQYQPQNYPQQNYAPQQPYQNYQQPGPGYLQQSPFQQQPQQPPKKKNRLWLILGGVLIVFVLFCGGFALFSPHTSTATTSTTTSSTQNTPASSNKSNSSSSNTSSGTYKVGQSATSGDWKVTVESVSTSAGDDLDTPKSGDQYLLIKVSETYTGSDQGNASSLLQFTLRDTNGQSYTETILASGATSPDGTVASGSKVAGTLAYEVPTATKDFQLSYEGSLGDDAVIYDIKA